MGWDGVDWTHLFLVITVMNSGSVKCQEPLGWLRVS